MFYAEWANYLLNSHYGSAGLKHDKISDFERILHIPKFTTCPYMSIRYKLSNINEVPADDELVRGDDRERDVVERIDKVRRRGVPPGHVHHYIGVNQVTCHGAFRVSYPRGLLRNVST